MKRSTDLFSQPWAALRRAAFGVLAAFFCAAVLAQGTDADPPGRVGRLSELGGQVWLYSPDAGDWIAAVRNQPLTTGDRLATDPGGRAEVQVGSTTLRLDGGSEVEVTALDDQRLALQLLSGSVAVRLRTAESAREFALATSDGRFRTEQPGRYRFDRLDRASAATVYAGQAVYEGERSALPVTAGQRAEFWIDASNVAQYSLAAPVRDAFVNWNEERDGREATGIASRYVSPEMTGGDELDRYGAWDQDPDYGAVWTPRSVAADWSPYSRGHWSYVRPWGWTWVDDAPWGFAPFHYGRWVYRRTAWCWVPGTRVARPVYAPALVAWVGGSNFNLSVSSSSGPAVGWFPLAPRDVYVPSYRYSDRYVRDVNITHIHNTTQINNFINLPPERREFGNRRFPHALTMVPASVVSGRQPVAPAAALLRNDPRLRDFADQPRRDVAYTAPPLATPTLPVRGIDPRTVRPPGFARTEPRSDPRFGGRPPPGQDLPDEANPRAPADVRSTGNGRDQPRSDPRFGGRPPPGQTVPVEANPQAPAEVRSTGNGRDEPRSDPRFGNRPPPGRNAPDEATPRAPADVRSPANARVEPRGDPRFGGRPPPGQTMPDEANPRAPALREPLQPGRSGRDAPSPAGRVDERPRSTNESTRAERRRAAADERPVSPLVEERRALPGTTNELRGTRSQPDERRALSATTNDVRPSPRVMAAERPQPRSVPDERRALPGRGADSAANPMLEARPSPSPRNESAAPRQVDAVRSPPPRAERPERAERSRAEPGNSNRREQER